VGLRPLTCCDCGFESGGGHVSMSSVNIACSKALRSLRHARSLVQRNPDEYCVSERDRSASKPKDPSPQGVFTHCPWGCREGLPIQNPVFVEEPIQRCLTHFKLVYLCLLLSDNMYPCTGRNRIINGH
jgi:hypothetical protein